MRFLEFFRQLRHKLAHSSIRDDLLMIALSVVLAIGITLIWTSRGPEKKVAPGTPEVPIEQPSKKPPAKQTSAPPAHEDTSVLVPYPSSGPGGPAAGGNGAFIAIVLDDMGPNREATSRAMKLPPAVTFSFLPYAPDVALLTKAARQNGHEILVHVPMEPLGTADPGPHALRTSDKPEDLRATLIWDLGQFDGYVGINNHMGSRLTADEAAMRVVMAELKARGVLFLDSRTTKDTKAAIVAKELGVPTLSRNVFLDNEEGGGEVKAELEKLEKVAREKGSAVAIGHPHPATLDVLEKWISEAKQRGFSLVPLTEVLKRQQSS